MDVSLTILISFLFINNIRIRIRTQGFQMWNLFSTVEPKVILPAKSLKEELLQQEKTALSFIEQELNKIITSINSLLKSSPQSFQNNQKSQISLIQYLESKVKSLEKCIQQDNLKFQDYITYRDQQKMNQQQFFKNTLRCYESKKSELNQYIQQLEDKVQALQLKGLKTYDLNPKPNNVLSGINHTYFEKYINKLQELKTIKKNFQSFALENKTKNLQTKSHHSSTQFTHLKQKKRKKTLLIQSHAKLTSLNDLEKELEMILIKEQIVGETLDRKILECKASFQSLAQKQNFFKQSIKKMKTIFDTKRKISTKNVKSSREFSQLNKLSNPSLKKALTIFISKPYTNRPNNSNSSIDSKQIQKIQNEEIEIENQVATSSDEQNEEQFPSQNFIQACKFLITQRFLGDQDQEQDNDEDLCEPQTQN